MLPSFLEQGKCRSQARFSQGQSGPLGDFIGAGIEKARHEFERFRRRQSQQSREALGRHFFVLIANQGLVSKQQNSGLLSGF